MASVRDSQKDLISVTVSDAPNGATSGLWTKRLSGQRKLMGGLAVAVLVCVGLVVALVVVSTTKNNKGDAEMQISARLDGDVCMTEGCIGRILKHGMNC